MDIEDKENPQSSSENENSPETENENNELEEYQERIKTLEHDLAVARADFYNFRQRSIKERQEIRKRTQEDTIIEFLPVLDNLERALEAANSEDTQSIIKGVEMVQRQFLSALENLGVSVINAKGEIFDPALHDAVATEKIEDSDGDGKIITERLKGYRTNERILRPSQVIVGKL